MTAKTNYHLLTLFRFLHHAVLGSPRVDRRVKLRLQSLKGRLQERLQLIISLD